MEHMCADVFQQTAATLRPPVEGQEPIPYRNLLPAKEPIHMALSKQFQMVLRKGWVDSRALHLFESLLNMGGVFWFTKNFVKVGGVEEKSNSCASFRESCTSQPNCRHYGNDSSASRQQNKWGYRNDGL